MKVLVTGATGLVGSHVCYHLCVQGYEVIALYRHKKRISKTEKVFSYYTSSAALFQKIIWKKVDLLNLGDIEDAAKDVEAVFNAAALVSFDGSDSERIIHYNTTITENLIHTLQEVNPNAILIHCSSIAALGKHDNHKILIDENVQWKESSNNSPYAISKFQSELRVWMAAEEGMKTAIVNPGIIIGPGFWDEGSGRLFTQFLKGFPFYTEGVNGFVDVNDVAKAMIQLWHARCFGQRFILVEQNYSYKQIFDLICTGLNINKPKIKISKPIANIFWRIEWLRGRLFRSKPLITKETAKSATNQFYYDGSKITKCIGFEYVPLAQTIKTYCQFLLKDKNLL
ncbi:MAG: NAD-dependent epimerase/dehydratase family protein [Thermaurantimonas sp.]